MTVRIGWRLAALAAAAWPAAHPATAGAADICVNAERPACVATIQEGIDAAEAGDRVIVARATYAEQVVVPAGKDGLVLRGSHGVEHDERVGDAVVIEGATTGAGVGLTVESANVTVENFLVRNTEGDGIAVAASATGTTLAELNVEAADGACIAIAADDVTVFDVGLRSCATGVSSTANGTRVLESRALFVGGDGVDITGDDAEVSLCGLRTLGGDGVSIVGDDAVVRENSVRHAAGRGVFVDGDGATVLRNRVLTAGDTGIDVRCQPGSCAGADVSRNRVDDVLRGDGIVVTADAAGATVDDNRVRRAALHAFELDAPSLSAADNRAVDSARADLGCFRLAGTGASLSGASASGCNGGGIEVHGDGAAVNGARVDDTDGYGIKVAAGSGATVSGSRSKATLGSAFVVAAGVTGATVSNNRSKKARHDYCDAGTATVASGNRFTTTFDPMGGPCPGE